MYIQYIVIINSKLKFLYVMNCIFIVSRFLWLILFRFRYIMFSFNCKLYFFYQNFYKDNINKEEMYIRYIKKLYDFYFGVQNYVEVGLIFKLYVQLLQWKDGVRKEEFDYLVQFEWERKERVYLQILDCFDKGKVRERVIVEVGLKICIL